MEMISRSRIATDTTYCPPVPKATYQTTPRIQPQTAQFGITGSTCRSPQPRSPRQHHPLPTNAPTTQTHTQQTPTSPSFPPPPHPLPEPTPQAPPPARTPQEHTRPQTHPAQTSDAARTLPGPGRARKEAFRPKGRQQKTQPHHAHPRCRKGSRLRRRILDREQSSWGTAGRRDHERIRRRGRC